MGFFDDLPADEPEPPRRHHSWELPEADLPGIVSIDTLQLARSDRAVAAITGMAAHTTGFEIFLTVRLHPDSERDGPPNPRDIRESFRFGVQFADGSKAISRHVRRFKGPGPVRAPRRDPETEPDGPILAPYMTAAGPGTHSSRWWVWPLPPAGPVDFVCEWPVFGIPETRTTLDATPILDAARRSLQLWPENEG
jgi:hypothetical protein